MTLFLSLLGKYWQYVVIVLLALSVLHLQDRAEVWHSKTVACEANRKQDAKDYASKQKTAEEKNKQEVAKTETHWQTIVNEQKTEYDGKLKNAYASVSAYADRLRSQTNAPRNAGTGSVPQTPLTTGVGQGTGEDAFVSVPTSDLYICAENTVKTQEWQKLWQRLVDSQP